jgi:hypothetical protein
MIGGVVLAVVEERVATPVVVPAGEAACDLHDVVLRVVVLAQRGEVLHAEREQLLQLPGVVLVRLVLVVPHRVQELHHGGCLPHRLDEVPEVALRVRVQHLDVLRHELGILDLGVPDREVVVREEHHLRVQRRLGLEDGLHPLVVERVEVAAPRLEGLGPEVEHQVGGITARGALDVLEVLRQWAEPGTPQQMTGLRIAERGSGIHWHVGSSGAAILAT